MALKVDRNRTFHRTLKDPEDNTEYGVELRKLSFADLEDRRQEAIKTKGKGRKQTVTYDKKAADLFTIARSVASWDIPFPPTPKELDDTEEWVTAQLFRYIAELNPGLAAELRAFDPDDEDEDDDEEEATEEVATAPEPIFGQNEGPTQLAAGS